MLRLEGKLIISMSQRVDSETADVNIKRDEQQFVRHSSASQFFNIKTIQDKGGFSLDKGLTSHLGYC